MQFLWNGQKKDWFTENQITVKPWERKALGQGKRCSHRKMLPDSRKTPHVEEFSTPVGCNLDTREKLEKTRGRWLGGTGGKKWRLSQQQICCLTSFKSRHLRIKDQTFLRRQFPRVVISRDNCELRWIEWTIMDIDHPQEPFEPWHACQGSIIALSIGGLIGRCLFHSTWLVYVYVKDTAGLADPHQSGRSSWKCWIWNL